MYVVNFVRHECEPDHVGRNGEGITLYISVNWIWYQKEQTLCWPINHVGKLSSIRFCTENNITLLHVCSVSMLSFLFDRSIPWKNITALLDYLGNYSRSLNKIHPRLFYQLQRSSGENGQKIVTSFFHSSDNDREEEEENTDMTCYMLSCQEKPYLQSTATRKVQTGAHILTHWWRRKAKRNGPIFEMEVNPQDIHPSWAKRKRKKHWMEANVHRLRGKDDISFLQAEDS